MTLNPRARAVKRGQGETAMNKQPTPLQQLNAARRAERSAYRAYRQNWTIENKAAWMATLEAEQSARKVAYGVNKWEATA